MALAGDAMARGDVSLRIAARSAADTLAVNFGRAADSLTHMLRESSAVAAAAAAGELSRRAEVDGLCGSYGELLVGLNRTMDAVVAPVTEASDVLARLAAGEGTPQELPALARRIGAVLDDGSARSKLADLVVASHDGGP